MKTHRLIALAVALAFTPAACSKCGKDTETAKMQAFEVKAKSDKEYREFDPKAFGPDAAVQERMIGMHFVEATHRLGDFSFRQTYQYDVQGTEKAVPLKGSDEIDQLFNSPRLHHLSLSEPALRPKRRAGSVLEGTHIDAGLQRIFRESGAQTLTATSDCTLRQR
ncbi:MAG: hypothetical protein HY897_06780 [Deltaproteobacteria bacterium]|nr:hypothetical protein [Deltaproteobacteria bacterium]